MMISEEFLYSSCVLLFKLNCDRFALEVEIEIHSTHFDPGSAISDDILNHCVECIFYRIDRI